MSDNSPRIGTFGLVALLKCLGWLAISLKCFVLLRRHHRQKKKNFLNLYSLIRTRPQHLVLSPGRAAGKQGPLNPPLAPSCLLPAARLPYTCMFPVRWPGMQNDEN